MRNGRRVICRGGEGRAVPRCAIAECDPHDAIARIAEIADRQRVARTIQRDHQIGALAGDGNIAGQHRQRYHVGIGGERAAFIYRIGAIACAEHVRVIAGAAGQQIVARSAVQRVIARQTLDAVNHIGAGERVIARGAIDVEAARDQLRVA